jgi:hypothetical protein
MVLTEENSTFRSFFRFKLPALWFEPDTWLEKMTQILLLPADICMQILNYIPRLRDLRNHEVPLDALQLEGKQRGIPFYAIEDVNSFSDRLQNAWNDWITSGSRYGLYNVFTEVGYVLDTTTYEYGIQERIEAPIVAYWGDHNDVTTHRNMVWNKFFYDGYIDSRYCYAVYVKDAEENMYLNSTRINEIKDICNRFGEAHTQLYYIHFTDGLGNILHTINVQD